MKDVFVVRHAEAEELADARREGRDEAGRRLTRDGTRAMRKGAAALAGLIDPPALILSSPLVRAVETAELLAEAFPKVMRAEDARLAPGLDAAALLQWVGKQSGTLMLVGHEPDLSQWIGYMVSGTSRSLVRLKKGSVCRLSLPDRPHAGSGEILWLMTLKQLNGLVTKT